MVEEAYLDVATSISHLKSYADFSCTITNEHDNSDPMLSQMSQSGGSYEEFRLVWYRSHDNFDRLCEPVRADDDDIPKFDEIAVCTV